MTVHLFFVSRHHNSVKGETPVRLFRLSHGSDTSIMVIFKDLTTHHRTTSIEHGREFSTTNVNVRKIPGQLQCKDGTLVGTTFTNVVSLTVYDIWSERRRGSDLVNDRVMTDSYIEKGETE